MGTRIAVVDYCKGNLASVERGLSDAGFDARITESPADVRAADGVVLPGVGAFADAMETMERLGQAEAIRDAVAEGAPFLGICLGLHLLFEWGDEGSSEGEHREGLALLPGHVERMRSLDSAGVKRKVPHVGWNSVDFVKLQAGEDGSFLCSSRLFQGVPDGSYFYFTHSYVGVAADSSDVVATTTHASRFASAVERGNVYGVQFHPEKSSALGLRVLSNFGAIVKEAS